MDFDDLKASEPFFSIILGILNGTLAVKSFKFTGSTFLTSCPHFYTSGFNDKVQIYESDCDHQSLADNSI